MDRERGKDRVARFDVVAELTAWSDGPRHDTRLCNKCIHASDECVIMEVLLHHSISCFFILCSLLLSIFYCYSYQDLLLEIGRQQSPNTDRDNRFL